MKQKIIKHIEFLINEHNKSGYCCDWNEVLKEEDSQLCINKSCDVGRHETLCNLLNDIKNIV